MSEETKPRIDFCACCGLRRPLGATNGSLGPGQETVRCIDCFFGVPFEFKRPEEALTFEGTAVLRGVGLTGDVVRNGMGELWFEPHGDQDTRVKIETKDQICAFRRFTPERYSVRSPEGDE